MEQLRQLEPEASKEPRRMKENEDTAGPYTHGRGCATTARKTASETGRETGKIETDSLNTSNCSEKC